MVCLLQRISLGLAFKYYCSSRRHAAQESSHSDRGAHGLGFRKAADGFICQVAQSKNIYCHSVVMRFGGEMSWIAQKTKIHPDMAKMCLFFVFLDIT